jgi:glycosyltransferase domain-containing protein
MSIHLLSFLQESVAKRTPNNVDLSLLTVVIPSYCRQDFVVRQFAYWHGSGAAVIIMDGSPQPLASDLQQAIESFVDITYVHSETSVVERLKRAADLVKTPYTVLCSDDEFLLFSGLCSAIKLLEQDSELVACIGQSLNYYLSNHGAKCSYGTGYDTYRYEIRQDHVQDRLNASMTDYNAATCCAVTRSPVWCRSWGTLHGFTSAYVGELEHAFVVYIWGKLGSVDAVYWMRSHENSPINAVDTNRKLFPEEWWESNKYKAEQVDFISKLGEELIRAQHIDRAKAEAIAINAFDVYLRDQYHLSHSSFYLKCRRFAVNVLNEWLPEIWVDHLKRLRCRLRPTALATGNFGNLIDLKATKTPLPFLFNDELVVDLSAMEKLIADFYKARSDQSE